MGCYSFYKIIKDILITLFGGVRNFRKFIIIIIVSIVLIFIYNNNCKAVVIDTGYSDLPQIDVPEEFFNYKFLITYYNSPQQGNCLSMYVNSDEFSISSLSYNSTYRYYMRTFSPTGGYFKNYRAQNVPIANVQTFINNNSSLTTSTTSASWGSTTGTNTIYFMLHNFDLSFGGTTYPTNAENFKNPVFYNKTDFLNFDNNSLIVYPNDFGISNNLYLHILEQTADLNDGTNDIYYYSNRVIALNSNSPYYDISILNNENISYYSIPFSVFRFQPNKNYVVFLSDNFDSVNNSVGLYDYSNDYDGFYFSPTDQQISETDVIINNQDNQLNQNEEFYNHFNSDNYDEGEIDSTFGDLSSSTGSVDNSAYVGFFTTLFSKFENVIDYNLTEIENLSLPVPFTNTTIDIPSSLVYEQIHSTVIYPIINTFWYFIFGLYIFKFGNKLINSIKSGEILKGWKSNDEVITSEIL